MEGCLIRVAVGRPVPGPFTYRLPPQMGASIETGRRLIVPLGRGCVVGFALGPDDGPPPKGLRDVMAILDDAPLFDPPLLKLLDWAARYYRYPLGEVLRAALPPGLSGIETPSESRPSKLKERWIGLTAAGRDASPRGSRMKAILDYLLTRPEKGVLYDELSAAYPASQDALRRLIDQGLCQTWFTERQDASGAQALAGRSPLEPTSEQISALATLDPAIETGGFSPFLLHGVTGSGKTEVYLRAIERTLELDLGALVLVPEIALTPQLVGRFRARFGEKVAVLHSGLRDSERLAEWRRLREGHAPLAVGVRSAIFAPVQRLGFLVVDEEHDGSFKQEEGFRYNARDLAVVRAQQQGCPVILGSATPSLETLHNAWSGRYRCLRLERRVDDRPMPEVRLIDLKTSHGHLAAAFPQLAGRIRVRAEEARLIAERSAVYENEPSAGNHIRLPSSVAAMTRVHDTVEKADSFHTKDDLPHAAAPLLSPELAEAIETTLNRGRQTILFLNRRGSSTYHLCLSCGQSLTCPDCAVSLTHHQLRDELLCHYCGQRTSLPEHCPSCGGPIDRLGMGTEQAENELNRLFPRARIDRLDRDTATRPDALTERLSAFARGERDILIGTQMVAKGHDFPGVLLVGVLLADLALNLPDFRASERTFQLLAQVAGRAGRGQEPGQVLVQTFLPQTPSVSRVVGHDFEGFAAQELAIRKAFHYPPFCRLMTCRVDGRDPRVTAEAVHQLKRVAEEALRRSDQALRLLGPAPAPISKLKGRVRWQMLFKGPTSRSLVPIAETIERERANLKGDLRISLDVDPLSML